MNERFQERKVRLAQLERELELLKKQRRVIERDLKRDELPEDGVGSRKAPARPSARPSEPAAPGSAAPAAPGPGSGPGLSAEPVLEAPEERERFAHYFMTGSLGHHAPQLRRERRAMRNKAVVTAILALILLIALVHFLVRSH